MVLSFRVRGRGRDRVEGTEYFSYFSWPPRPQCLPLTRLPAPCHLHLQVPNAVWFSLSLLHAAWVLRLPRPSPGTGQSALAPPRPPNSPGEVGSDCK